jgi:hypothetical protein
MGNRQSNDFYQGARYEYAATLCLSSFSAVVQVPRPEDYGYDHICTLIEIEQKLRYPRKSFGVQVKPLSLNNLIYGEKNDKGEYCAWETKWLFERDFPLLFVTVNLEPFCFRLYSTWNIWHAYWMSPQNYNRQVNLLFNQKPPNTDDTRWKSYPKEADSFSYNECDVYVGDPIVELNCISPTKPILDQIVETVGFWLDLDWTNLQYRKLGIPFMYTVKEWKTNVIPTISNSSWTFWNKPQGTRDNLLRTLAPMVIALEEDFKSAEEEANIQKLEGLREILINYLA